jgi:sulfite reductase alpha subunit-like flavoprotein
MSLSQDSAATTRPWSATLVSNERITAPESPEDVRRLRFTVADAGFDGRIGQCLSVLAPGQFGQRWHERLYSIADLEQPDNGHIRFELLVRRCHVIDPFNGERYDGVASNLLCNLTVGGQIQFTGPVGHPFPIPEDRGAGLLMIGMGTGIAPFRGLVRRIYDELGGWQGPVWLFYGARSGLELLYLNDEKADLGLYYDRPTFQAFAAVSPRPHFGEPPAVDKLLIEHAVEVWSMLQGEGAHLYIAGPKMLLPQVDSALAQAAGSVARWTALRADLATAGRWHELLY